MRWLPEGGALVDRLLEQQRQTQLVVVEKHHHVLMAWAELRRKQSVPPRVLTLDHHTDTSPPFRTYLKASYSNEPDRWDSLRQQWIASLDFNNPRSVEAALSKLSNDEHLVCAIQSGLISSALVVSQNAYDTDLTTYHNHSIICRGVDRVRDARRVLETELLESKVKSMDEILCSVGEQSLDRGTYILDIDLDYFTCLSALAPSDSSYFQRLVSRAALITIATEPEYVSMGSIERGLTAGQVLERLLCLMESSGVSNS